jgi:drug/metabolite transporter (DMT)-like permease
MIGGIAVALAAACCYELAYVVQALETRQAGGGERIEATLLGRLLRRPRWVAGTALAGVGALLQIWALTLAPLTVVQPTLALGLVLLLVLSARVLHEPVGRRERLGVAMIVGGVALVALTAAPEVGEAGDPLAVALLVTLLAVPTLLPFVLRSLADARLRVLAAAAGDALAAIGLKLVADATGRGSWLLVVLYAAGAALAGLLALTAEMSALQRVKATRVAPVVLAGQVLVPALAGPLAFGEQWGRTPLAGVLLALALLTVAAGAALLGASGAVADVIAGEERDDVGRGAGAVRGGGSGADQLQHDVGGERQPRERLDG